MFEAPEVAVFEHVKTVEVSKVLPGFVDERQNFGVVSASVEEPGKTADVVPTLVAELVVTVGAVLNESTAPL